MIENLMEFLAAAGLQHLNQIEPRHMNQRTHNSQIHNFAELYESLTENCLHDENTVPKNWRDSWAQANATSWE